MNLEELFCLVDDFCNVFIPNWEKTLLTTGQRRRKRLGRLHDSEVMTLYLLFQSSNYRHFKHYYLSHVLRGDLSTGISPKRYRIRVLLP